MIWLGPSPRWVKINCDGAAIGSPGRAATGGLCRDFTGSAIFSFASPVGVRFAFEAELLAVSLAVDKAFQLKLSPVWIESDSFYVIKLLHSRSAAVPWQVRSSWQNCLNQLTQLQFHASHVYREGNQVADKLACMGLYLQACKWWSSYPSSCHHLMLNDAVSMESYRFR